MRILWPSVIPMSHGESKNMTTHFKINWYTHGRMRNERMPTADTWKRKGAVNWIKLTFQHESINVTSNCGDRLLVFLFNKPYGMIDLLTRFTRTAFYRLCTEKYGLYFGEGWKTKIIQVLANETRHLSGVPRRGICIFICRYNCNQRISIHPIVPDKERKSKNHCPHDYFCPHWVEPKQRALHRVFMWVDIYWTTKLIEPMNEEPDLRR